jgi:DNA-directed RNA polymerase sigma subunit (sigma70/sigma32)
MLNVTRERVRQIEAKALKKLRPPKYSNEEWMGMDGDEKLEAFLTHHKGVMDRRNKT